MNPWSYLWVGIGGHDAEKYLRLAGLSARNPIFSCTQIDTAKSYILDMMKHHALSAANEIYIQGILMQFLALLVEDAGCTVSPQQNTSSVYINQAISYIHKNYQNPLTVQEIADYLSFEPELSDGTVSKNRTTFPAAVSHPVPDHKIRRAAPVKQPVHPEYCLFLRIFQQLFFFQGIP